jgi:hypothetical protein
MDLIYETPTMLAALSQKPPIVTFLRDRYFPTDATSIFGADDVLLDIKKGGAKLAPVVIPHKDGITVERDAYRTERVTPAFVAPKRNLTADDLKKRQFGEALFIGATPEQRSANFLASDLAELDEMITRREEYIASRAILGNGYTLVQYADEYGKKGEDYDIRFYEEDDNPATYTPADLWNTDEADILKDITAMVRKLTAQGLPAVDLIGAPDAIDALLSNEPLLRLLDNRNVNVGELSPTLAAPGVSNYGHLAGGGSILNLFSYEGQYQDDTDGEIKSLFPTGYIAITAPGAGRAYYGAITQMEPDEELHTFAGTRIPKYVANRGTDSRELRLASRPLFAPAAINPWISAKVL